MTPTTLVGYVLFTIPDDRWPFMLLSNYPLNGIKPGFMINLIFLRDGQEAPDGAHIAVDVECQEREGKPPILRATRVQPYLESKGGITQ